MSYTVSTEQIQKLQSQLSPACWEQRVEQARYRLSIVESLLNHHPSGCLSRAGVREVAPGVSWGNARRWWDWYHNREGEPLERMFDRRQPEKSWEVPVAWKSVVHVLCRQQPSLTFEEIREALVAEFGQDAMLSDSTLRRIFRDIGFHNRSFSSHTTERVTELSGGGGLILVLAAMIETGELHQMAEAIINLAETQQSPKEQILDDPSGRDERGHFTPAYNHNRLATLGEHGLQQSIDEQRPHKELTRLRLTSMSIRTLEHHLRCLTVLPLLTDRRGVSGLNGPAGAWLEILSPVAYLAATVGRTLTELKWLEAASVMWDSHARSWLALSQKWAGEDWMQAVFYVDATKDPWWTQHFAKSSKVSRTGRVQPCLTRTVFTSGPGVPIIAEVVSGHADLSTQMFNMMNMTDKILGESRVSRVTVVDAECCERKVLRLFQGIPNYDVVTVLKGPLAVGKKLENMGEWMNYRERDWLREAEVNLEPAKASVLKLRVVEMVRPDSRHPKSTWFITTADIHRLSTQAVADVYLKRWPFQEDLFRRGRNGIGLEHSSGYGVKKVAHVAIVGKREVADQKLQRATQFLQEAKQDENRAASLLNAAQARLEERSQANPTELNGRHELGVRLASQRLKNYQQACRCASQTQLKANEEVQKLQSMPDEIYVRDTALDAITTCLKMMLLALLEFICQEYLEQYRLMPRTFIEAWMFLPVTIRQQQHCIIYEIAKNTRDPAMTRILERALECITALKLRIDGRLLVVRLRDSS